MKLLRLVSLLLLVAGSSLTSRAVYLDAKARLAGVLIRRAWEETLRTGEARAPWPWADMRPIARLRIPRLGYDEIVLDAATPRVLAFGPARLLSGAAPGQHGNLVLAGHRTSWFRRLKAIRDGDTVELQWYDARANQSRQRSYTIREIRIVDPADVALLGSTPDDALTLVTCYPFGSSPRSPQRYIVRASPLDEVAQGD